MPPRRNINFFGGGIIKYTKFKSYKTAFAVFFSIAMLSSVSGFILFQNDSDFSALIADIFDFTSNHQTAFIFELMFLLALFTAGPTIYAPAVSVLTLIAYGMLSGAGIACQTGGGIFFSLLTAILDTVCMYLIIIYSSFVTLTGLRLFSNTPKSKKGELFDGVLFRAENFKSFFNYRFLLTYIGFFFAFLLAVEGICLLKLLLKG